MRADGRWKRVRDGLKRLPTGGAHPYWIHQRVPALLAFESVREEASRLASRPIPELDWQDLGNGLVSVLQGLVHQFRAEPDGVLLRIVMALEETYVAHGGETHSLLEMEVGNRRDLAGREFQGPLRRNQVTGQTVRVHHEPPAIERLGVMLLRKEVELTHFWADARGTPSENPPNVLVYLPGEVVPKSGHFVTCTRDGTSLPREVSCNEGERFPPTLYETDEYGWSASPDAAALA